MLKTPTPGMISLLRCGARIDTAKVTTLFVANEPVWAMPCVSAVVIPLILLIIRDPNDIKFLK